MNDATTRAVQTEKTELGNGESAVRGLFAEGDGTFLALTFTASKVFETERGAAAWLLRQTGRHFSVTK